MAVLVDPICYQFHFSCVMDEGDDETVKQAFEETVRGLKPFFIPYLNEGMPKTYCRSTGPNGYPDGRFGWIGSSITTGTEPEKELEELLQNLQQPDFHGFLIRAGDFRHEFMRYPARTSSFSKQYSHWFGVHWKPSYTDADFFNSVSLIKDFLNCPTDDLSNVTVPINAIRNRTPFELSLYRTSISALKGLRPHLAVDVITSREEYSESRHVYQMSITIPRFLLTGEADPEKIQREWKQIFLRLGQHYPVCFGVLGMDCPQSNYIAHGNTCYDKCETRMKKYFAERIPGYSWCTLINRSQVSLIPKAQMATAPFFEVISLENGAICFQTTPDIRCCTRETATSVREFLKPYLPSVKVSFWKDNLPPSLRLGFTEEEMLYEGREQMYLFQVVHEKSETS